MSLKRQYLTYDEYRGLGGIVQKVPFALLEYRAEKEIDSLTFNRFRSLHEYPTELKMCVIELINEINNFNNKNNNTDNDSNQKSDNIASESVGNYSVSYVNKNLTNEQRLTLNSNQKKIIKDIIYTYLSNIKVNGVFVLYIGDDTLEN